MKATPELFGKPASKTINRRRQIWCDTMNELGPTLGYDQPWRLAQVVAQVGHESGGLRHIKEVWGPTAAQRGYEGRRDLGNDQPGDGKRFSGHLEIQVTGRYNHRKFTSWARTINASHPDFEAHPELMGEKYLGLATLWYFSSRVPMRLLDAGDLYNITKRVNGGLNGLEDRYRWYGIAVLSMLDYDDVKEFQRSEENIAVDGVVGPTTAARMHKALQYRGATKTVAVNEPPPRDTQTDLTVTGNTQAAPSKRSLWRMIVIFLRGLRGTR